MTSKQITKTSFFLCIIKVILLFFIENITLSIVYIYNKNMGLTYLITYSLITIIFFCYYYKNIISNIKNLLTDIKKNLKPLLIYTVIFAILTITSNIVINNIFNQVATNDLELKKELLKSPYFLTIATVILAPIVEELSFRFQYKDTKKNIIKFIIISLIFALFHINFNSFEQIIYIIPYFFLSLSFGYAFYKTDNIVLSIIIHIINNLINVIILFM